MEATVANTYSIHLVPKTPKPQPLDPADIAAAVLDTVRECSKALRDMEEYQEWLISQMSGELKQLEVVALRAMTKKARRS
jgi:hypothetical protein